MALFLPPPPKFVLARPAIIRPGRLENRFALDKTGKATFPFPIISPTHGAAIQPVNFIGNSTGVVSAGTYTYSSVPLTPAAADRVVVVLCIGSSVGNYSTTSVVCGATTLALWSPGRIQLFTSVVTYLEFYFGVVAAGAAPNIVMTTTASNMGMNVWTTSGMNTTPKSQISKTSASGTSCAINSLLAKTSGGVIAGIATQNNAVTLTESWSGSDLPIEDNDSNMDTNVRMGGARVLTTATLTGNFTFNLSASKTFVGGGLSFGP